MPVQRSGCSRKWSPMIYRGSVRSAGWLVSVASQRFKAARRGATLAALEHSSVSVVASTCSHRDRHSLVAAIWRKLMLALTVLVALAFVVGGGPGQPNTIGPLSTTPKAAGSRSGRRRAATRQGRAGSSARSPFLVEPAASFQVQAVSVVKFDAFLFEQTSLEGVAAIAGQAIGYLALRVNDAMPRDLGYRVKALKYAANKAGPSRQAGHRGDLAIGCNPAERDAADYGANRFNGFIALAAGSLTQLARR